MTRDCKNEKDCKNETGAIWKICGNMYKAHCKDPGLAKKIASWEGCERGAVYHCPDGHREMDVIFPGKLYNRVAELLKLPFREKNPKRVAQGQKMSVMNKKHRFLRNTKLQNSHCEEVFKEKSLRISNTLGSE
jgi:hypothetical protein